MDTGDLNPKRKGEVAEGVVTSRLLASGLNVFGSESEDCRVDMVVDDGELHRVQVKSGNKKNGSVCFSCNSIICSQTEMRRDDYFGDIDVFVVYCWDNDLIYAISIDEANKNNMRLRIDEMKIDANVNWANDYLAQEYFNIEGVWSNG